MVKDQNHQATKNSTSHLLTGGGSSGWRLRCPLQTRPKPLLGLIFTVSTWDAWPLGKPDKWSHAFATAVYHAGLTESSNVAGTILQSTLTEKETTSTPEFISDTMCRTLSFKTWLHYTPTEWGSWYQIYRVSKCKKKYLIVTVNNKLLVW